MELGKWDKRLWRANGLIIFAGACFFVIASLGFVVLEYFQSENEDKSPSLEQLNTKTKTKDKFRLTSPDSLPGTNSLLMKLVEDESSVRSRKEIYVDSYSSGSGGRASTYRNYLIYDKSNRSSHWVFPSNDQEIYWPNQLEVKTRGKTKVVALAFEYKPLIEKKSSQDANSKRSDEVTSIAIYDLKDHGLKIVLSKIEESLGVEVVSEREILVFYFKDSKPLVAHYDLNLKKITETKSIELPHQ